MTIQQNTCNIQMREIIFFFTGDSWPRLLVVSLCWKFHNSATCFFDQKFIIYGKCEFFRKHNVYYTCMQDVKVSFLLLELDVQMRRKLFLKHFLGQSCAGRQEKKTFDLFSFCIPSFVFSALYLQFCICICSCLVSQTP